MNRFEIYGSYYTMLQNLESGKLDRKEGMFKLHIEDDESYNLLTNRQLASRGADLYTVYMMAKNWEHWHLMYPRKIRRLIRPKRPILLPFFNWGPLPAPFYADDYMVFAKPEYAQGDIARISIYVKFFLEGKNMGTYPLNQLPDKIKYFRGCAH